jgi:hypothetical protein
MPKPTPPKVGDPVVIYFWHENELKPFAAIVTDIHPPEDKKDTRNMISMKVDWPDEILAEGIVPDQTHIPMRTRVEDDVNASGSWALVS